MRIKKKSDLIHAALLKIGAGAVALFALILRIAFPVLIVITLINLGIEPRDIPSWIRNLWSNKIVQGFMDLFVLFVVIALFHALWNWRSYISRLSKQYKSRALSDDILTRKKPKIFYLRSFELDVHGGEDVEIILAKTLARWGDLITVGKPEEKLPILGAVRMYLCDADWKKSIEKEFSTASLIIIHMGVHTPGLWWEVERTLTTVAPEKVLLFVCGTWQKAYDDFRKKLNSDLNIYLPLYKEITRPPILLSSTPRSPLGFFAFDSNWNTCFLPIGDPSTDPRNIAQVLEPVFKKLNIY